eukprot:scaffold5571_cov142-Isochrysis_galbana.AAC.6
MRMAHSAHMESAIPTRCWTSLSLLRIGGEGEDMRQASTGGAPAVADRRSARLQQSPSQQSITSSIHHFIIT